MSANTRLASSRDHTSLVNGCVAPDDLAHLRFDLRQVLGGERLVAEEVVVEAVLDHRPDGHLRARIEVLHRLRHDVRGVVADERQRPRVVAGDDLDARVLPDRVGEIGERAVERHRHRLLGERLGDAFGDIAAGDAGGKLADGIVGKGKLDHRSLLLTPAYERG